MARPRKKTASGELKSVSFKADKKLVEDLQDLAAAENLLITDLLIDLMERHRAKNKEQLRLHQENRKSIIKE